MGFSELFQRLLCTFSLKFCNNALNEFFQYSNVFLLQSAESTVAPSLRMYLHMPTSGSAQESSLGAGTATLFAVVATSADKLTTMKSEWQAALIHEASVQGGEIVLSTSDQSGTNKVVIITPKWRLPEVVQYVAAREEVIWLEEQSQYKSMNIRASKIIQGGISSTSTPLWQEGLTGRNQIIGIADTGLDYKSAFFRDSAVAVPFCQSTLLTGMLV